MQHEVGELLDEAIWSDVAQLTWLGTFPVEVLWCTDHVGYVSAANSSHPPRRESFLSSVFTMDMLHQLNLDIPTHRCRTVPHASHIVTWWSGGCCWEVA